MSTFAITANGKTETLSLTEQEQELMRGILIEEHRDGNDALAAVWVSEIEYHCALAPTSIGGVMRSAKSKGVVGTDGETCWLTTKGRDCMFSFQPLSEQEEAILNRPIE